jgi:hypothetical protein
MAELSEETRLQIWRGLMRWWSQGQETLAGVTKGDLKDAVDATDEWIDDNQASYNAALPEAARTNLTQAQKTLLFCAVALARVSVPFLRSVFKGVD